MKKALFLLAVLFIANMGFAQLPYATLNHNDTIQVFTGQNALQQAHNAAVGGDIINLSSGVFDAVHITKGVTIRGAAVLNDTARGLVNTIISGSFTVNIPDSVNRLTLTGLYFNSDFWIYKAFNPLFKKCRFQTVAAGWQNLSTQETERTTNPTFINCFISSWRNSQWNSYNDWSATNPTFYNCIIWGFYEGRSPDALINCNAIISSNYDVLNSKSILNCILMNSAGTATINNNGLTCFNTIGLNTSTWYGYHDFFDLTNMESHHLYNFHIISEVFQSLTNFTYTDGMSMALVDSIATTILGDDGTQVGIYGGQYPFDFMVTNPQIGNCTAARRTNAQGKLEVDIEIINDND